MEGLPHGYEYMEQDAWHHGLLLLGACPIGFRAHVASMLAEHETQHMNCFLMTRKDKAHMFVHTRKVNHTQAEY